MHFFITLQRGRTPKSAESGAAHSLIERALGASTGPHSEECGERPVRALICLRSASTGPHSEECGELSRVQAIVVLIRCFNGAALRRVRRGSSMGRPASRRSALQRGRTPKSAERLQSAWGKWTFAGLQRGRTPKSAESPIGCSPRTTLGRFNGAALRRVRRDARGRLGAPRKTGFNGAALRRVRRVAVARGQDAFEAGLQRGRTPKSAERMSVTLREEAWRSFNGAALRRVRRVGFFFSRGHNAISASTGPHSEECGEEFVPMEGYHS